MQEWFQALFAGWFGAAGNDIGLLVSIVVKIVIILVPLILTVAYLTYFERKVIGFMQLRVGPNVTGPWGLIQPFADVLKLTRIADRLRQSIPQPLSIFSISDIACRLM